jgi:AraC-like DNA-binding protein
MTVALGGYREYRPPADLRDVVEALWSYSRPEGAPPIPGEGHRVLPEAGASICFWSHRDRRDVVCDPRLTFIGPAARFRFFNPDAGLHMVSVRLKTEWTRDLLRVDPGEHLETDDLCLQQPLLIDRLTRTRSSSEALVILVDEIRRRRDVARVERATAVAHEAVQRVRAHRGTVVAVESMARLTRVSERQLRRWVVATMGLTLKHVHRIVRFNRAIISADRQQSPDWAALAADSGFYDQSHLINEVRAFTGLTPAALHAERRVEQG